MKNAGSKIKLIKLVKSGTTYCLGCKDYTDNFNPQEMTNKVIREKSYCVVC